MMEAQKIMRPEGQRGVGPATVIAEFHFENLGTDHLHNCANLSAHQPSVGHVAHQSDNGKEFEICHYALFSRVHKRATVS